MSTLGSALIIHVQFAGDSKDTPFDDILAEGRHRPGLKPSMNWPRGGGGPARKNPSKAYSHSYSGPGLSILDRGYLVPDKETTMPMQSLVDLFVDKLKDIHDAEKRITRALPKMAKAAASPELAAAFEEHLGVTEKQIERLDRIFQGCEISHGRKTCHGMKGILEEGEELLSKEKNEAEESVMDAALIAAAQEVEHYEIGAYGCLKAWAELLGWSEEARLLSQSLEEEELTDEKLTELASAINPHAMQARGSESEQGEAVQAGRGTSRRQKQRRAS